MGNANNRMPTQALDQEQSDRVERRRRVATYVDGNVIAYESENFTVAENQSVLNVITDLGRKCHTGYFINDGPGDIKVEFSINGTVYGGLHVLRGGDAISLDDLNISKIRLTHVDDCEFRCLVG